MEQQVDVPETDGLLHAVTTEGSARVDRRLAPERPAALSSSPQSLQRDGNDDAEDSSSDGEGGDEDETDSSDSPPEGSAPQSPRSALEVDDRPPSVQSRGEDEGVDEDGSTGPTRKEEEESEAGSGAEVEGEEDASETEDDDDDEDEDEEPTLKYSRLEGSTAQIFSKDTASAIAVCDKYIVRLPRLPFGGNRS